MEILDTILTVLYGLLMLMLLVLVHEGGHFFVGKACDIRIDEFSIGFGPKLWSKQKQDIIYSVRALPLGGYVQFYGEDEAVDAEYEPRAFTNRPIWQRAVTIAAGPLMNFLFALLLTVILLVSYGEYVPELVEVPQGYPAYEAGLQVGDRIVMLEGDRIDFSMEMEFGSLHGKEVLHIGVERDGQYLEFEVPVVEQDGKGMVGITYTTAARQRFGFFEAIGLSFKWIWLIVLELFEALGAAIFGGAGISQLSGPVGTVTLVGQMVRYGPEMIMRIAALLSMNLGVMNILPFPAMDGGRLVMLGIEKLIGRPLNRKVEAAINLAGMALLFALMIALTWQDISRLFAG